MLTFTVWVFRQIFLLPVKMKSMNAYCRQQKAPSNSHVSCITNFEERLKLYCQQNWVQISFKDHNLQHSFPCTSHRIAFLQEECDQDIDWPSWSNGSVEWFLVTNWRRGINCFCEHPSEASLEQCNAQWEGEQVFLGTFQVGNMPGTKVNMPSFRDEHQQKLC